MGPLEVIGRLDATTQETIVHQRLYIRSGAMTERRVGRFVFHASHYHWHMDDFARYEILPVSEQGELLAPVATSSKVGYCIMDVRYHPTPGTPQAGRPWPQYQGCNNQVQGLSAGWSDTYEYYRPDQ